jgi:hypothetical protein
MHVKPRSVFRANSTIDNNVENEMSIRCKKLNFLHLITILSTELVDRSTKSQHILACFCSVNAGIVKHTGLQTNVCSMRTNSVDTMHFCDAASKKLYITADDEIIHLYVNGVATSFGPGGWPTVRTVDIPDSVSVIAVEALDLANVSNAFSLSPKAARTETE